MSQRGIDFLRKWIKENINEATYPPLYDTRAKVFSEQCAADAQKEGICVGEIEEEMGDLTDCMLRAMDEATNRHKRKPADLDFIDHLVSAQQQRGWHGQA